MKMPVSIASLTVFLAVVLFAWVSLAQAPNSDNSDVLEDANYPNHDEACQPVEHEPPTPYECEFDTDCLVCHDGSACGRIVDRATFEKAGPDCLLPDSSECEYTRPRCCEGFCVRSGF